MDTTALRATLAAAVITLFLLAPAARAADEKKLGWSDTAELGLVATSGNSESTSFSLKNETIRAWERARFNLKFGGLRVESWTGARTAIEDASGNIRVVDPESDVSAENYYANARYGREISTRMFWFTGASWERNEFAGYDNRWVGEGGVGNAWHDTDDLKFLTGYAVTYTKQDNIVDDPDFDDTFIGYRFTWKYLNKFGGTMTYTNDLILDGNVEEGSAWRGDMDNGFAVAMTDRLALKLGLRFLYQNAPALELVTLFDESGNVLGTTPIELDELDTTFTASVVVNFD